MCVDSFLVFVVLARVCSVLGVRCRGGDADVNQPQRQASDGLGWQTELMRPISVAASKEGRCQLSSSTLSLLRSTPPPTRRRRSRD